MSTDLSTQHTTDAAHAARLARPNGRGWILAGAAAAVLTLVGLWVEGALANGSGEVAARDAAAILAGNTDNLGIVVTFQITTTLSALLLVVFAAGLRRRLAAQGPVGSILPEVAAGGMLLVAVTSLVGGGPATQVFFDLMEADAVDPDLTIGLLQIMDTIPWLWSGAALTAGAVAVAGLRHGSLPRWLGWMSAAAAVVVGLVALAPVSYMTGFLAPLWLLVASLGLARRERA